MSAILAGARIERGVRQQGSARVAPQENSMYAKRTPVVAVVVVIVAAIALTAAVFLLRPGRGTTTITDTAAAPVTNTTPSPSAKPPVKVKATATPTDNSVVLPTVPANYHPIPENALSEKGLDFGFLTAVTEKDDGLVLLTFDRANFYTGAEAARHNGGQEPPDDYLIVDDNTKLRTFTLDPKASVQAENVLRNDTSQVGREKLTVRQLARNYQRMPNPGQAPGVWLRHSGGPDGQVTALAEQFTP
jgi:hypothetical protein